MPLPLTNLDDRRWTDLVDQGIALIPRYAPAWTDQNVHDPGRTLIELFAWLTEMTTYRLNQVPGRHRSKFLALLGFTLRPPQPAEVVLSFTLDVNTTPFVLPTGTQFETTSFGNDAPKISLSTQREVTLSDASLVAVQIDLGDGKLIDHSRDWREGLAIEIFGGNPFPGSAIYFGFKKLPPQVPVALWLRFQGPGDGVQERRHILEETEEQERACRKVVPGFQCSPSALLKKEPVPLAPHHSVRVVWEVFTGTAGAPWLWLQEVAMPSRPATGQVVDDTRSLTLDGLIEFAVPASATETQLPGTVTSKLFYVRCRLASGGYDVPPVLLGARPNSVVTLQSIPVAQTFQILAGVNVLGLVPTSGQRTRLSLSLDERGQIQSLQFSGSGSGPEVEVLKYKAATNVTPGEITLEMAFIGTGTGRPLDPLPLPSAPLETRSLRVFTHSGGVWQEWIRCNDLDSSQRTDFHFVIDSTNGLLVFGEGERGRTPADQELIFVLYETTLADSGNVTLDQTILAADNLHNQPILSPLTVAQQKQINKVQQQILAHPTPAQRAELKARIRPQAIEAGAAEESLEHLTGRAVERLHAHEQLLDFAIRHGSNTLDQLDPAAVRALAAPTNAVDLLDFERLALDVPGTNVSRAQACASSHPDYPCLQAPGFVRVVILPAMPVPEPKPTAGLVLAVKRFLDRRRTVCTRVEVVGPRYVRIRVTVRVKLQSGASAARVVSAVDQALSAFLDPFKGGPKRRGWPFGRSVYRTEIMQLVAGVHGVSCVTSLSMSSDSGEELCGDIPVCPGFLVSSSQHIIQAER